MVINCRTSFGLGLGLLALVFSSPAEAGYSVMTSTVVLEQTTTDFSRSVSLATFNSSLGTLVNVVISYSDSGNMHGFVQNTSSSAQTFKVTEDSTTNLSYGSTQLLTNDLISAQTFTHVGPTQSAQFNISTPTGSAGPATISSGPLFDAFLQPSSNVMLTFSTLTSTTVTGGGGNISTGIYTTVGGSVTVQYEYLASSAVPEPASVGMTVLGGALILGARARKRRRN